MRIILLLLFSSICVFSNEANLLLSAQRVLLIKVDQKKGKMVSCEALKGPGFDNAGDAILLKDIFRKGRFVSERYTYSEVLVLENPLVMNGRELRKLTKYFWVRDGKLISQDFGDISILALKNLVKEKKGKAEGVSP